MSYLYDVEQLFDDLETIMKANLNNKIDAINTAKNDDVVLDHVLDTSYIFQSLDERVANCDPFVFYGMSGSVDSDAIGPAVAKKLPIHVAIISFAQNKPKIGKRYFRYNRALEEVFLDNWNKLGNGITLKVQSPVMIDFALLNNSDPFRVVGVQLEAHLS